jgi:hypothetical protein
LAVASSGDAGAPSVVASWRPPASPPSTAEDDAVCDVVEVDEELGAMRLPTVYKVVVDDVVNELSGAMRLPDTM